MTKQTSRNPRSFGSVFIKAISTGFFGGVIWSSLFLFMHTFNMTEVDPFILFKMIFGESDWISKWYAYFILIIAYGMISVFVAIIYYFLFRKKITWIVGGIYGAVIYLFVYYILPILLRGFNPFITYDMQSHLAIFCLLLLYGVFVGYSISYDYKSLQIEFEKQH